MNDPVKATVVRTIGFKITREGKPDLFVKQFSDGATLEFADQQPPAAFVIDGDAIGLLIEALTEITKLTNGAMPPEPAAVSTRLGAVEKAVLEALTRNGAPFMGIETLADAITDRNKSSIAASCRQLVAKGRLVEVDGGYRRVSQ